jgi:hypothetical protein
VPGARFIGHLVDPNSWLGPFARSHPKLKKITAYTKALVRALVQDDPGQAWGATLWLQPSVCSDSAAAAPDHRARLHGLPAIETPQGGVGAQPGSSGRYYNR